LRLPGFAADLKGTLDQVGIEGRIGCHVSLLTQQCTQILYFQHAAAAPGDYLAHADHYFIGTAAPSGPERFTQHSIKRCKLTSRIPADRFSVE
jgi:hypothetical protein